MKLFVSTIFMIISLSSIAQDDVTFPKNEIKTNVLNDLLGIAVLSYERILNEESGVGLTVASIISADTDVNFTFQPYYRQYFGNKPAAGFFVEGAGILLTASDNGNGGVLGGVGLVFGTKLLSKKNMVFEGFLGLGRLFTKTDDDDFFQTLIYPRAGISIGKRF